MNAVQQAEQAGFDMSLIDESLRCSYEQRALQHQEALSLALELERASNQIREQERCRPGATPGILIEMSGEAPYLRDEVASSWVK